MNEVIDVFCPWCSARPIRFFGWVDPKQWKEVQERACAPETPCGICARWSQAEWIFECDYCKEPIESFCIYVEPCANPPYVQRMIWNKCS